MLRPGALAVALAACSPAAPSPTLRADAPSAGSSTPTRPQPAPARDDGLRDLVIARPFVRMVDCGHDGTVGPLRCGFTVAGEPQPVASSDRLRPFVTEPPGLVLAAVDWEPARALGEERAVVAECELTIEGALEDVHLGAVEGVTGYRLVGRVDVGRATACRFEPRPSWGTKVDAAHLLVAHADAQRAPPGVTRSRDEAASLARAIAAELDAGALTFAAAVAKHSDEDGARQTGGSLGTFAAEALAPEFTFVVLGTPIGARSPVFESAFGFHVVERRPPR